MRTADHPDTALAVFWPGAPSGVWSLHLIALAVVAAVSSMVAAATGQRGGSTGVASFGVEGAVPP